MTSRVSALALAFALACPPPGAQADTYTYDALGRLKQHQTADGKVTTYAYDAAGNRTTVTTAVGSAVRAPNPQPDTIDWFEGWGGVQIPVRANDSDPGGQTLTVVHNTPPARGTAVRYADRIDWFPAQPSANRAAGPDTFTYVVQNASGMTAGATVTVMLRNLPPSAAADSASVVRNGEVVITPLANDTDPGGDALTLVSRTNPAHGTLTAAGAAMTYRPASQYSGPDSFTYVVQDAEGAASTGTVSITVLPGANQPPVANTDFGEIVLPGLGYTEVDVLLNDSDPDNDWLTITSVTQGQFGTVTIQPGARILSYQHTGGGSGDSFTYTISDGQGHSATATVLISFNVG